MSDVRVRVPAPAVYVVWWREFKSKNCSISAVYDNEKAAIEHTELREYYGCTKPEYWEIDQDCHCQHEIVKMVPSKTGYINAELIESIQDSHRSSQPTSQSSQSCQPNLK